MPKLVTPEWVECPHTEGAGFYLRPLPGMDMLEYQSFNMDPTGKPRPRRKDNRIDFSREQQEILLRGVKDWRGYLDGEGNPAPFSKEALVEHTDLATMSWLLTTVLTKTLLSEGEEKNS